MKVTLDASRKTSSVQSQSPTISTPAEQSIIAGVNLNAGDRTSIGSDVSGVWILSYPLEQEYLGRMPAELIRPFLDMRRLTYQFLNGYNRKVRLVKHVPRHVIDFFKAMHHFQPCAIRKRKRKRLF